MLQAALLSSILIAIFRICVYTLHTTMITRRIRMEFSSFLPVWSRLTAEQQAILSGSVFNRKVKKAM